MENFYCIHSFYFIVANSWPSDIIRNVKNHWECGKRGKSNSATVLKPQARTWTIIKLRYFIFRRGKLYAAEEIVPSNCVSNINISPPVKQQLPRQHAFTFCATVFHQSIIIESSWYPPCDHWTNISSIRYPRSLWLQYLKLNVCFILFTPLHFGLNFLNILPDLNLYLLKKIFFENLFPYCKKY